MSNTENEKTLLQTGLLYGDSVNYQIAEIYANLTANLNELFTTLEGDELVETVIRSTQDFIAEQWVETADTNLDGIEIETIQYIKKDIREKLTKVIARFISDEHREAIVRYHARGISTAEAVEVLITESSVMQRLAQRDAIGEKHLKQLLISRLAYLKPGTARWPEKKYGSVWREERQLYIQEINNTAFSTPAERIALLANHAERVNRILNNKEHSVEALQSLTQSLIKTVESLEKLSPTEQQAAMNVPTPQLPSVIERFTVALEAFQQIAYSGEPNAIVEIMEKFTLAMQPPSQQNAIIGETEEKPEENTEHTPQTTKHR